jgi:diacylglycerol kinase (ATP)
VPRDALLLLNAGAGPRGDAARHERELVDLLGAHGIRAQVRVIQRAGYARAPVREAARSGPGLVIAAGGDGTVEAVARGLVRTGVTLGIIPLGTYNNVATCLGIPRDVRAACALIGEGTKRAIDVGLVEARGATKPRAFFEMGAVGLAAALMPVGEDVEKRRWRDLVLALPPAVEMAPTDVTLRLDGSRATRRSRSLLVEVANAPRVGAGLLVAPEARLDDGLLRVAVYEEVEQAALAARFVALKAGLAPASARIARASARRLTVRTAAPLPVLADSKVVGTTPAAFAVLPGALSVVVGRGFGLAHPPSERLVAASARLAALPPALVGRPGAPAGDGQAEVTPPTGGRPAPHVAGLLGGTAAFAALAGLLGRRAG